MMRPTQTSTGEARYRGVRKRSWGKWVCEIRLPNSRERIWLGSYDSAEKAAHAFDAAMYCLRGRRGRFNFPNDIPNIPGGRSLTPQEIRTTAMNFANNLGASTSQRPTAKLRVDGNDMSATASPTFSVSEVSSDDAVTDGDIDWSSFSDWLAPQTPRFSGGFATINEFQTEFFPQSDNLNIDFCDDNGGDVGVLDSQHSSLWSF